MPDKQFYFPTDHTTIERLDVLTEHIMYLERIVKKLLMQISSSTPADTADQIRQWTCNPIEEISEEFQTATSVR